MTPGRDDITSLLFELIRISFGDADAFATAPSPQQWGDLMEEASRQSILPALFTGIERLPSHQAPPREILMQWFVLTDRTETLSAHHEECAARISAAFADAGFRSCILKGRSAAALYPVPSRRSNGDIDIWADGGISTVLPFIEAHYPTRNVVYHHAEIKAFDSPSVEVHFTPTWMFNPVLNSRLQRYFRAQAPLQTGFPDGEHPFRSPSPGFDAVYQMIHIYRHFFDEGVGLRHLCDYCLVLKACGKEERDDAMSLFGRLRMKRFAGAVMWVMQEVFSLPREHMLCAPDERYGKVLLDEVMLAGNFGKYDPRVEWSSHTSDLDRFITKIRRQARFVTSYPSELLWSPFFKIWHWSWRKTKNH